MPLLNTRRQDMAVQLQDRYQTGSGQIKTDIYRREFCKRIHIYKEDTTDDSTIQKKETISFT